MEYMILVGLLLVLAIWAYMWFLKVERGEKFKEWLDTFNDVEWEIPISYMALRDGEPV